MDNERDTVGCPYRLDTTASDIHGESARLRAMGPVAAVELPGGVQARSVTDPDLIRRLLTSPLVSKDAHQHWPAYIEGEIPAHWPLRIWVDVRNALAAYGEEHKRLRRLIGSAFGARRVRALEPVIESITTQLLDELEAHADDGQVDLRARFAWVLPLLVVNSLLGVPEELHDDFRTRIGGLFDTGLTEEEALANGQAVYELLARTVAARRAEPGDDVTSVLVAAHDDETDSRLSEQELLDSLLLLIGAGHETTVNLLDHAVVNLLTHPDQLGMLRDGSASWADAIEECLRHQAPIANIIMRFPVQDFVDEASGERFHQGEALVINYAAAGRDPAVHDDPDRFDITRADTDHLAFGHGIHYCLGAELARLEARIALPALFARFPGLELATPAEKLLPLPSFISNGHQELPVRL
jgi:cytochrome P450